MHITKNILATSLSFLCTATAFAGDLNAPADPSVPGSAMHTLEGVYNRLATGEAGSKRPGSFTEPAGGPTAGTGHSLDEVMNIAPEVDDTNGATTAEVLEDKAFWGLRAGGDWGLQTGSMPDREADNASSAQSATAGINKFTAPMGFYDGTDTVNATDAQVSALDTDIVTGNIHSGITIFGVSGKAEVVDTSSGDAVAADIALGQKAWVDGIEITGIGNVSDHPAPVPETGQTIQYSTTPSVEDGGANPSGITLPSPRFTDNSDGTVTDNLTGLVWLTKANCIATDEPDFDNDGIDGEGDGLVTWQHALDFVVGLNEATYDCGDTSNGGSNQSDWRLPTERELHSLINFSYSNPALSNAAGTTRWTDGDPFSDVQSDYYWSSTTLITIASHKWVVSLDAGFAYFLFNQGNLYVWPVRAGQ